MNNQKKALICGITGQDGAYLAKHLLERDYLVFGTSRDAHTNRLENLHRLQIMGQVQVVSMAPNDFRSVFQVVKNIQPDEIYNLAGQSSVGLSFEQPVEAFESIAEGALNLIEVIRLLSPKTRLFNSASSDCFGNIPDVPANELTPFRPRSPYAVAKAAAFWTIANYREAYSLYACSGILSNHESPLRQRRFVTQKIICGACSIAANEQEYLELGDLSAQRDWGWAPDYVEGMYLMLQQQTPDDFVIATGQTHSLEDFTRLAFEQVGLDWRKYVRFNQNLLRPTDISRSSLCPQKIAERIGWRAKLHLEDIVLRMTQAHNCQILA